MSERDYATLVNGVFTVFSYLFVALKVLAGAITVGGFTQYAGAMTKLANGLHGVTWNSNIIKMATTYMGDFKLFSFPLWQNLAAGYEREDDKIRDSLERAGAWDFVKKLPQGAETLLFKDREGGVDISGGEAQKLAIARALYKDAPFVVLDEPTAALDPISEAEVYTRFHEMVKDKTSIYISHRMASCRFCDDIVVFEDGRIVERGSHEELLARQGQYAGMWHAQAKYYVEQEPGVPVNSF